MAFHWRADDGPTLNIGPVVSGSGPALLRNPIFLYFLGAGVRTPGSLSGSAHESHRIVSMISTNILWSGPYIGYLTLCQTVCQDVLNVLTGNN